jgi:uncharacterized protein
VPAKVFGLIDTGAIIALVDRNDKWHEATVAAFRQLRLPLATTAAVLAEVFHFMASSRERQLAWKTIRSEAIRVMPIHHDDLEDLNALMERYADRPMDFADATLVHLAARESLSTILTIDHDDFETYRFGRGRRFRVMPPRQPTS